MIEHLASETSLMVARRDELKIKQGKSKEKKGIGRCRLCSYLCYQLWIVTGLRVRSIVFYNSAQ